MMSVTQASETMQLYCKFKNVTIMDCLSSSLARDFPHRLADQKPLASEDWEVIYNHRVLISPKFTRLLLQYIKA